MTLFIQQSFYISFYADIIASKGRNGYYDYYHCGNSCGTRFKANIVNDAFLVELKKLEPRPGLEELCTSTIEALYDNDYKAKGGNAKQIMTEIDSLNEKS